MHLHFEIAGIEQRALVVRTGSSGSRGRCAILRCMTENEIRALLSSIEPTPFVDRTPGTVALLRSRVEEAGADSDEVARWVEAKGGHLDHTQPFRLPALGPNFGRKISDGKAFYVVPTEALAK